MVDQLATGLIGTILQLNAEWVREQQGRAMIGPSKTNKETLMGSSTHAVVGCHQHANARQRLVRVWHAVPGAGARMALALLVAMATMICAPAWAGDKVVYHIDDAQPQGLKGLRNIRNHLDVAPDTRIVVVTHANGVDLLFEDGKDAKSGTQYAPLVSALKARGVTFEVCEITLKNRDLQQDQFSLDAEFTPSGVVRVARLQAQEGFGYIKP